MQVLQEQKPAACPPLRCDLFPNAVTYLMYAPGIEKRSRLDEGNARSGLRSRLDSSTYIRVGDALKCYCAYSDLRYEVFSNAFTYLMYAFGIEKTSRLDQSDARSGLRSRLDSSTYIRVGDALRCYCAWPPLRCDVFPNAVRCLFAGCRSRNSSRRADSAAVSL